MPHADILKCADGSYAVGSTTDLERRLSEHQSGYFKGCMFLRRPVELVWSGEFPTLDSAFHFERQGKG